MGPWLCNVWAQGHSFSAQLLLLKTREPTSGTGFAGMDPKWSKRSMVKFHQISVPLYPTNLTITLNDIIIIRLQYRDLVYILHCIYIYILCYIIRYYFILSYNIIYLVILYYIISYCICYFTVLRGTRGSFPFRPNILPMCWGHHHRIPPTPGTLTLPRSAIAKTVAPGAWWPAANGWWENSMENLHIYIIFYIYIYICSVYIYMGVS